jgi:hypothetical protein
MRNGGKVSHRARQVRRVRPQGLNTEIVVTAVRTSTVHTDIVTISDQVGQDQHAGGDQQVSHRI